MFLPLNVIDYKEWDEIGKKYFADKNIKVAIIHEGLIPYFNKTEQAIFRDNVGRFLEKYSPNGAWITSDLNLPQKMNDGLIIKFVKKIIERYTKRKFNYFANSREVADFLNQGNFHSELLDNSSIVNKITCVAKLNFNKEKVRGILERYRAYFITLKK